MQDIMKLAHQFLQNFCAGNQQNQALLHKHINLFLNPGVSSPAAGDTPLDTNSVTTDTADFDFKQHHSVSVLLSVFLLFRS